MMAGMHRPPGRNRKSRGRVDDRPSGPRTPPPSATGLEAKFFEDTIGAGTRVELSLTDGSTVRGILREFDRNQIMIERETDSIVVRKSTIRYISES